VTRSLRARILIQRRTHNFFTDPIHLFYLFLHKSGGLSCARSLILFRAPPTRT
jgi:hypothetical protein